MLRNVNNMLLKWILGKSRIPSNFKNMISKGVIEETAFYIISLLVFMTVFNLRRKTKSYR